MKTEKGVVSCHRLTLYVQYELWRNGYNSSFSSGWFKPWKAHYTYVDNTAIESERLERLENERFETDMQEIWPGLLRKRRAFLAQYAREIFPRKLMRWVSSLFKEVQIHGKRKVIAEGKYRSWW